MFHCEKARLKPFRTQNEKRGEMFVVLTYSLRLLETKKGVRKAKCIFHAFLFLLDFSFHAHVIVLSFLPFPNRRFLLLKQEEMLEHIKTP